MIRIIDHSVVSYVFGGPPFMLKWTASAADNVMRRQTDAQRARRCVVTLVCKPTSAVACSSSYTATGERFSWAVEPWTNGRRKAVRREEDAVVVERHSRSSRDASATSHAKRGPGFSQVMREWSGNTSALDQHRRRPAYNCHKMFALHAT